MKRPARPSVCYLCGELGANSKDHVPPKCLVPRGGHRVTLWAHAECNTSSSRDEEYVRDLIGPNAGQYDGGQETEAATWRSWSTPAGDRRRRMFLKDARPVELRSPAGLLLGQGLGINYDRTRVANVGLKIARGLIFMDSGAIVRSDDLRCVPIDSAAVPAERERETAKGNPFWLALSDPNAYHTNFAPAVAVRRGYYIVAAEPVISCSANLLVMFYGFSCVVVGMIQAPNPPPTFKMFDSNELPPLGPSDGEDLA